MRRFHTALFLACLGVATATLAEQQPATITTSQATVTVDTVTASELADEALSRNPLIRSGRSIVEARRHRVRPAGALPDPTISVGWNGDAAPFVVQTGDPSSSRMFSVTQEFPLAGKRGIRSSIARREADIAGWDLTSSERRVVAEVKVAFFEYAYAYKAAQILERNRELLQKLSKITEVRYQVGKASQADVARSHLELSRIQQRATVLEQQKQAVVARLNALLYRAPETPLPTPAELTGGDLQVSLDDLYAKAKEGDPELQRRRQEVGRDELATTLARREYVPDLAVGYTYQQRPLMPDMNGMTFSLRIPVFYRSKQRELLKEAQSQLQATHYSQQDREATLFFEVKEQYLAIKAAENLIRLYKDGIVPQSSVALESSMSAYQVGSVDFLTVLTNYTTLLDYETEYYRELANRNIALARLEPMTGVELVK